MEIRDLSHDEKLAFAALLECTLMADGEVSEAERDAMNGIVAELGDAEYRALLDEVDERFSNRTQLKEFLRTVKRQEARETIFGTILDDALAEALDHSEKELLDWLAREWAIEVEIEPPEVDQHGPA